MPLLRDQISAAQNRREAMVDLAARAVEVGSGGLPADTGGATISPQVAAGAANRVDFLSSSDTASEEQYKHFVGTVYSAIRAIAQRGAGQSIKLARTVTASEIGQVDTRRLIDKSVAAASRSIHPATLKGVAVDEELEILEDHPFLTAVSDPNEILIQWGLIYVTLASLELTGKAHWWIVQDNDRPQIWPLPSHWVSPLHADGLYAQWRVSTGLGTSEIVPGDQVAYFAYPDPRDPLGAISPLQANSRSISADESIQEAQARAFKEGIFPKLGIVVGRHPDMPPDTGRMHLTPAQRKELIAAILKHYQGVLRKDHPMILDALIEDVKPLTRSIQEMDFRESGKDTRARILQGYGVNPIILGEVEGANRASAAVADEIFCDNTMNPKLDLISQVLTAWVVPAFARDGERLVAWIEPCRPKDREHRLKEVMELRKAGAISKNEERAMFGLPRMEGGDTVLTPMNLVDSDVVIEDGGSRMPATSRRGFPGQSGLGRKRIIPADRSPWLKELGAEGFVGVWLKNQAREEARLKVQLANLFDDQRDSILKEWDRLKSDELPGDAEVLADQIFRPDEWNDRLFTLIELHLTRAAVTGALTEMAVNLPKRRASDVIAKWQEMARAETRANTKRVQPSPEDILIQAPPAARREIRLFTNDIMKQPYLPDINGQSRQNLVKVLKRSMKEGLAHNAIGKELSKGLGGLVSRKRGLMISRTEVTGAVNAGHQAVRTELTEEGIVHGKQWLAIIDVRTRGAHRSGGLHMVKVRTKEPFKWAGSQGQFPGAATWPAALRVNCRCTTLSVTDPAELPPLPPGELPPPLPVTDPPGDVPLFGRSAAKVFGSSPDEAVKMKEINSVLGTKFDSQDLASAVGAPDDAQVFASKFSESEVRVNFSGKGYTAERRLARNIDGDLVIHNDWISIDKPFRGQGLGTEIFGRQVENARKLGFQRIRAEAGKSATMNGYYTWPRLGYDGNIPQKILDKIPAQLGKPKTIQELMATVEGRAWWKANGNLVNVSFDLGVESRSSKVLHEYLKARAKTAQSLLQISTQELADPASLLSRFGGSIKKAAKLAGKGGLGTLRFALVNLPRQYAESLPAIVKTLGEQKIVVKYIKSLTGKAKWTADDAIELKAALTDLGKLAAFQSVDWGVPGTGVLWPVLFKNPKIRSMILPRSFSLPKEGKITRFFDAFDRLLGGSAGAAWLADLFEKREDLSDNQIYALSVLATFVLEDIMMLHRQDQDINRFLDEDTLELISRLRIS